MPASQAVKHDDLWHKRFVRKSPTGHNSLRKLSDRTNPDESVNPCPFRHLSPDGDVLLTPIL